MVRNACKSKKNEMKIKYGKPLGLFFRQYRFIP